LSQLLLQITNRVPTERTVENHTEQVVSYRVYCMSRPRTTQLSQCKSSPIKSCERSRTLRTCPAERLTRADRGSHGEHAAMLHDAPSHASPAHHTCFSSRWARQASAIARGAAVHHRGAREHGLRRRASSVPAARALSTRLQPLARHNHGGLLGQRRHQYALAVQSKHGATQSLERAAIKLSVHRTHHTGTTSACQLP
jgi:hypothetical protein